MRGLLQDPWAGTSFQNPVFMGFYFSCFLKRQCSMRVFGLRVETVEVTRGS